MKLAEALSIIRKTPPDRPVFPIVLVCGFTPLHLQNYLGAYLQKTMPGRRVTVETGLYDDVAGTLELFGLKEAQTGVLVLEWPDLDPRLGYRQLGGWGQRVLPSVLESVSAKLKRLEAAIDRVPSSSRLAVALPTVPLPPAFHTPGWQASEGELALEEKVAGFARRIAAHPSVLLMNKQRIDARSPAELRYDPKSDLHTGFPYTMGHADALGCALAALVSAPQPKKGLITDLDDTLWAGIVGELGHEGVAWDLASHAQVHGLYQQMLHALADQGVLVAIASKNSPEVVEKALGRADLAIQQHKMFPVEVHWEAKSGSVSRILKTWNVGADSVVFVDDSPMELEEVRVAHPGIECIPFPKSDYQEGLRFLHRLRDLFGKARLSEEDAYRLDSIRQGKNFAPENESGGSAEQFLSGAEGTVTLEFNPPSSDKRVVELVNKTNQFNLNGIRYTDGEWHTFLQQSGSFALAISYRDKFGPLGKVAVVRGRLQADKALEVDAWVMSCRAFSRRIEQQTLAQLFHRFEVEEISFRFESTAKNGPVQDLFARLLGNPLSEKATLTRAGFEAACPKLYHQVVEQNG